MWREARSYATAFLIAGVIIPTLLHMAARESMPWWPDTASTGLAFGAAAIAMVRAPASRLAQRGAAPADRSVSVRNAFSIAVACMRIVRSLVPVLSARRIAVPASFTRPALK